MTGHVLALSIDGNWHYAQTGPVFTMAAMPITYLKRALPPVATHDTATAETVRTMLDAIAAGGEPVAQAYAAELDG